MIEVDRAMMEDYKIELLQMMENAGRNLAHLARERFLNGDPRGKKVTVLAGTGGNGGGALVSARRLHNYGAQVQIFVTNAEFTPIPVHELDILHRMGVAVAQASAMIAMADTLPDLIIDGVSLAAASKATPVAKRRTSSAGRTIKMLYPNSLWTHHSTTTGTVFDPAINATATMTLALPKEGLRAQGLELYLADTSVPPELYNEPALTLNVSLPFEVIT